jgi:hypothetical protein
MLVETSQDLGGSQENEKRIKISYYYNWPANRRWNILRSIFRFVDSDALRPAWFSSDQNRKCAAGWVFLNLSMKRRVVMTIHDALWVEAPVNEEELARNLIKKQMESFVKMPFVSLEMDTESLLQRDI